MPIQALDPALRTNAAPLLVGGASQVVAGLNSESSALVTNLTSEAITRGAERNLGVESVVRQGEDLIKAHESGMSAQERDRRVQALVSSLSHARPGQGPGQTADVVQEAAETMKRLVKAIMRIMRSLFAQGSPDPSEELGGNEPIWAIGRSGGGSSGYGPQHDRLLELLTAKDDEFQKAAQEATKRQDAALDDGLDTPQPSGARFKTLQPGAS